MGESLFTTLRRITEFLFRPEDSTEKLERRYGNFFVGEGYFADIIKGIFWIANSVAVGMLISQLK